MRKILKEIQSGQFAKEFILENQVGRPMFDKFREAEAATRSRRWASACAT